MTAFFETFGARVIRGMVNAGRGVMLLRNIVLHLPKIWRRRAEIVEQMHVVALGSLPLVLVTSVFVGAVTAVQAVYQMNKMVPLKFLGVMISKTVFIPPNWAP
ncbi:hypothetical protein CSA17_07175 [bacterium DOLJORAL78_65_58]|nr:MAG: hypothetical protein CSA17_07175 [bacterium DOLJORAL78_65_58]